MHSQLALEIRNARRAAGLTQTQLGTRLGLKGRAVYRWERDASSPTKRHQRALVLAIQAINPAAASALATFIASAVVGGAASAVALPVAQPVVYPAAVLENALYQAADELDLPARQLRVALARLFARLRQASLTLESAGRQIEQWSGTFGDAGDEGTVAADSPKGTAGA
jgi:transcriptional regulator with XRE-family HTH domain